MEIEFDIVNKSYDGNDSYIFDVADNALHNYSYSVMLTSPTMSVIRVYDVPEDFVCINRSIFQLFLFIKNKFRIKEKYISNNYNKQPY